jgi:hypothetical protein
MSFTTSDVPPREGTEESDSSDFSAAHDGQNTIYLHSDNLHGYDDGRTVPSTQYRVTFHPNGLIAHLHSGSPLPDRDDRSIGQGAYPDWLSDDAMHKYRQGLGMAGSEIRCTLTRDEKSGAWSGVPEVPLSIEDRVLVGQLGDGGNVEEDKVEERLLRVEVECRTPACPT